MNAPAPRHDLLSIVVVHFDIPREFPRTLYSLSPAFQRGISADEYEVIVVDNGSKKRPKLGAARELGLDVHLITVEDPSPSPARAINIGLNASCGKHVGVMIDGARLASPGLLATARDALRLSDRAVVGSRGRYLGPKTQRDSMREGYTRQVEDELLESIDWQNDGDRLFEISVFDESSGPHWFQPVSESNSIFMSRHLWREVGGYDPVFDEPGGGYVNLDVWRRACMLADAMPIVLLGEATFHQLHGGVATNSTKEETARMRAAYETIRGEPFSVPPVQLHFFGHMDGRPPVRELGLTKKEQKNIAAVEERKKDAARRERTLRARLARRRRRTRDGIRRVGRRAKRSVTAVPGVRPLWRRIRARVR